MSRTDTDGNTATITRDATSGKVTEVVRGGSGEGQSVTESWLYSYVAAGTNAGLLANVLLRRQVGGSWATVRQVDYAYYDGSDANGNLGDLRTATVKDGSGNALGVDYYRYYKSGNFVGGLKYALGYASYDRAAGSGYSPLTTSDAQLRFYADDYYEYDSSRRVSRHDAQGEGCSACSGGIGSYTYTYTVRTTASGYNNWAVETVETLPDNNRNTYYSNADGMLMLKAYRDVLTSQNWVWDYQYDAAGRCVLAAQPSAVSSYSSAYDDLVNGTGSGSLLWPSAGLVATYDYYSSTTATGTSAGGVAGSWKGVGIQHGTAGTAVRQLDLAYFEYSAGGATVHPLASRTAYRNADGTGGETTGYGYTYFSGTAFVQSMAVTHPAVTTPRQ